MDYGAIIKRSWGITWRYKALWVLGIFAGVSGCSGGGGGNSGGGDVGSGSDSRLSSAFQDAWGRMHEFLPVIIAGVMVLVFLGIIWWVLSVAARGGLVTGVSAIADGSPKRLRDLWAAGFQRFWSLFGLSLLLGLPLALLAFALAAAILVPLAIAFAGGSDPGAAVVAPVCGAIGLGIPLLIVSGFVLGIMEIVGERYVMLGGQGAFTAAKNGWLFLRARFKDTFLMWLVNAGLNLVAAFALAIPVGILAVALAATGVTAVTSGEWGPVVVALVAFFALLWVIGCAYSAIWGTFTSSLWTLFFRQVVGMDVPAPVVVGYPVAQHPGASPTPVPEPPAWPQRPAEPSPDQPSADV